MSTWGHYAPSFHCAGLRSCLVAERADDRGRAGACAADARAIHPVRRSRAAGRPAANPAAAALAGPAHRLGGEEPLPPVPPRGRFPAPCRGAEPEDHSGIRTADGGRDRRARLGARDDRQSLRRPDGRRDEYLRARRHARVLSRAGRSSRRDEADRRFPPQASCAWVFDEGDGQPRKFDGACGEDVRIRLGYGKPAVVTVDVAVPDGPPQRATTESRGARSADRRHRRLDRGGRGQSGPAGRAVGRGLLLPPFRHGQRILSARAARRSKAIAPARPRTRRASSPMDPARRALAEPGLPSLALRLSAPHRAGARGREPACRGDVPAARLHRRDHRVPACSARSARELNCTPDKALPEHRAGADHAASAISRRGAAHAAGPHARSRAAHRRRQRHRFLRPRRQCHHRPAASACCSAT